MIPFWGGGLNSSNAGPACLPFFIALLSLRQAWLVQEMKNAPWGALDVFAVREGVLGDPFLGEA